MKRILIYLFLGITVINKAHGQSTGTIDRSFGENGFRLINLENIAHGNFNYTDSKILSNGDYFISGKHPNLEFDGNSEILIKMKANGTADSSFSKIGFKKFGAATANRFDLYRHAIGRDPASGKINIFSLSSTTDLITLYRFKPNGDFDSTFGNNGVRYTTVKTFNAQYTSIAYYYLSCQADGKLIIGGTAKVNSANERVFLYRLKPDGTIDSTFGASGISEYLVNSYMTAKFISPGNNDAIFVSVYVNDGNLGFFNLIKINKDGVQDMSFGSNGKAAFYPSFFNGWNNQMRILELNDNNIWIMHVLETSGVVDMYTLSPNGIVIRSQRITLFNFRIYTLFQITRLENNEIRALVGNSTQPTNSLTVIRIKSNGNVDSTFGVNGLYTANIFADGFKGAYTGWRTTADSTRILAFGVLASGHATALKLKPEGFPDSSYATNGSAVYKVVASQDYLTDIETLGNGKICFLGFEQARNKLFLGRLDTTGRPDHSFGTLGVVNFAPSAGIYGTFVKRTNLLRDPADTSVFCASYTISAASFILHKFKNDGQYDPAFGNNGQVNVPVSKPIFSIPKVLHLSDGKFLVLIGSTNSPTNDAADILVVRLKNNGTKDSTFGTNGIVTIDQILSYCTSICFASRDFARDIVYTSDNKILVTGSLTGSASYDYSAMFRLNNNGSKDLTFGSNGIVTFFSSGTEIKTTSILEQENQKYLVTFNRYNPLSGARSSSISRYNYNGSADPTFLNTVVPNPTPGGTYAIQNISIQADKKINAVCVSDPSYTGKPYVVRFKMSGTADSSFGTNGIKIIDTLRVLPATDVELNNFTYFRKDINGRLVVGAVGQEQQLRDVMLTRVFTGDAPAQTASPANDDCINAQNIVMNAPVLLNQSTELSTQSLPPVTCNSTSPTANDIWYKFTATSNFAYIIVSGSSGYDGIIQAFSSCGGSSLLCSNNSGTGIPDTLLLSGLTAGNPYFFRVYEEGNGAPAGSSFSVKVEATQATFSRHTVKLKNKQGTPFSLATPSAYLSQRAIDRRTRYGIAIDSTDLPVTPSYITQIAAIANVTVLNVSKWHNSVTVQTTDANAITTINGLSFVQNVSSIAPRIQSAANEKFPVNERPYTPSQRVTGVTADYFNYGAGSLNEINLHKGQFLHNIGLRGQGMAIAMLDGGFFNYNTLDAMDSVILNNQVLDTWDFYSKHSNVADDHPHGMQCLSTIAANIPGQFIGKAPKANFMLYGTEDVNSEYPIEEFNMVCGMERADSAGADLISASIGYADFDNAAFNHTYAEMNGNTTIAAIGADLAAKKGILFVIAAGNEGNGAWHFIITPADADSALAVGAVSASGVVGSFSSYGPSSDGQVKPDVASIGVGAMVQSTANTVATSNGTSFACPNMAGLSTILWQGFPEVNNMRIVKALREAGSIASAPNDRIGYGIPDLRAAFGTLLVEFATSTSTLDTCTTTLSWTSKDVSAMKYEIERKLPGQSVYTKVGEVIPQPGNLLTIHSYQFNNTIINSPSGSVFYRIRQIIDTASASFAAVYIDTTAVSISSGCFANFLMNTSTSSATINNCTATVNWTSKDNGAMRYEIERKLPGQPTFTKVADMPAQPGNVLSWHSYSFNNTIINSPAGIITYRVRQIIDTAAASFADVYLQTATVNISDLCFANYLISTATSSTTISGCSVTVSWSSSDNGSMKYEIERKAPSEINFSKVGELNATPGVSLASHSYQFVNTLTTGSSGAFSYRIRQIIDTAAATFTAVYIDTTVANVTSACVITGVNNPGTIANYVIVRPNPSVGTTASLIIETTDAVPTMPILIYNMQGRLVQRLQESKGSGKKIIDISVGKLAKGKYFINVYNKNVLIGTAEFIRL